MYSILLALLSSAASLGVASPANDPSGKDVSAKVVQKHRPISHVFKIDKRDAAVNRPAAHSVPNTKRDLQLNDFQQEVLDAHNILRARHEVPDLTYNIDLENYARDTFTTCNFDHSDSPYGENLAAGYSSPTAAIQDWYDEIRLYDFNNPGFSEDTGHFTQVVWKSSAELGCYLKDCNGEDGTPGQFLICEYNPFGNIVNPGYFEANVLPCQYDCDQPI